MHKDLFDAAFIAIESFYPGGRGVRTPVWNVYDDGAYYVWTEETSYKVKRIRGNPQVRVCKCDAMGTPLGDWFDARAEVLSSKEAIRAQQKRMARKYGVQFWGFYLFGCLRRRKYVVIKITLLKKKAE
jgi:PPOX class probable F420-dependent enzyme